MPCVTFCRSRDLVVNDVKGMLFSKRLEESEKSRTGKRKELEKDVVLEKSSLGLIDEVRALEWVRRDGTPPPVTWDITSWKRQLLTIRGQLRRERGRERFPANSSAVATGHPGDLWQGC